jgi:hypothetical protein
MGSFGDGAATDAKVVKATDLDAPALPSSSAAASTALSGRDPRRQRRPASRALWRRRQPTCMHMTEHISRPSRFRQKATGSRKANI